MADNCEIKKNLRVCVSGGHQDGNDKSYVDGCYKMGEKIAKMGFCLDYGFSNSGVMGAVARGVMDGFEKNSEKYPSNVRPIIGVTTKEYYDLYEKDDFLEKITQVVIEDSLENRKNRLLAADIVVFAPGGVGTLDELAYDCVAMQDGFLKNKPFIIYNIKDFFYHILESLKELSAKGFATRMPFIVVNDSWELEMAFRLIQLHLKECVDGSEAYASARQLAYEMPYFLKRRLNSGLYIEDLVEDVNNIRKNGTDIQKQYLAGEIEQAYLEKEIERMYERLEHNGADIGNITEKLANLKKRKREIFNKI
ncbi:MAG: LOG family protein [Alphaproteobacteria bacterium]|nr:LOG family protein [Alphaproteobacteria bacterium]